MLHTEKFFSLVTSGSFIIVNNCDLSFGFPGLVPRNKPNLSLSVLLYAGVAAAPAHTACQDGGVVAENLRSPMQRSEDDAV